MGQGESMLLRLLKYPEKDLLVSTMPFMQVDGSVRIYHSEPWEETRGFDFYITDFAGTPEIENDDLYSHPDVEVNCLYWGTVAWDGLRHMWMGDEQTDNENYLYCVPVSKQIQVFTALKELMAKRDVTDY